MKSADIMKDNVVERFADCIADTTAIRYAEVFEVYSILGSIDAVIDIISLSLISGMDVVDCAYLIKDGTRQKIRYHKKPIMLVISALRNIADWIDKWEI